jgi:anti-sigma B factor antagonist
MVSAHLLRERTAMELSYIEKDGVHIVAFLEPTLFEDVVVQESRREIEELLAQPGVTRLLLDLRSVNVAGSAALGMLIRLKSRCAQRHCHLALCGLQPSVQEAVRITQLDKIFEIYQDIEPALTAFRRIPAAGPPGPTPPP